MSIAGLNVPQHERVSMLVAAVGGPVKAAALTGRARSHIDNMRRPNAPLRVSDLLPLCEQAGVSLDWVATGHQVRPDLMVWTDPGDGTGYGGMSEAATAFEMLPGFVRLRPVRPQLTQLGATSVKDLASSQIAVSAQWLDAHDGLSVDTVAYGIVSDDGMASSIRRGALVIVDTRPVKPRSGIYLVAAGDDELIVRRLYLMPGGRVELTADADPNWRFSPPSDSDLTMYRVVWAGQDM